MALYLILDVHDNSIPAVIFNVKQNFTLGVKNGMP